MKDRIKKIRKQAGLNQTEFGLNIGVRQSAITGYETGAREPLDAVIKSMCSAYQINEQWLRTGEGEMYLPKTKEEEIADLVKKFFDDSDPRKLEVVKWFVELDDNELELLEGFAKALLGRE